VETRSLAGGSVQLSVIGQGTWQISTRGRAAEQALEALASGVELGMTHIDTAEMYGSGEAEKLVGRLFHDKGMPRERVVLASKVLPQNASYRGTLEACERSLKRLGTSYLDLYMIHWPGPHPIADTMRALEELVDAGKVRALGVSNFDVEETEAARRALRRHPLAFNQVLYHLKERSIERRLLPYCVEHEILVVGYSPFGQGNFPEAGTAGRQVLDEIGSKHGRTAREVALRFLTRHPAAVTIPKAERAEHVRDNARGVGWQLSEADVAAIDRAFPVRGGGALPML
jgi:diketogulonate reductase-like aldo/keto reductase